MQTNLRYLLYEPPKILNSLNIDGSYSLSFASERKRKIWTKLSDTRYVLNFSLTGKTFLKAFESLLVVLAVLLTAGLANNLRLQLKFAKVYSFSSLFFRQSLLVFHLIYFF